MRNILLMAVLATVLCGGGSLYAAVQPDYAKSSLHAPFNDILPQYVIPSGQRYLFAGNRVVAEGEHGVAVYSAGDGQQCWQTDVDTNRFMQVLAVDDDCVYLQFWKASGKGWKRRYAPQSPGRIRRLALSDGNPLPPIRMPVANRQRKSVCVYLADAV
jgi:hypothetical protein